jgi:hypothetical protein
MLFTKLNYFRRKVVGTSDFYNKVRIINKKNGISESVN